MKTIGVIGYGFVGRAVGQMAVSGEIRVIPFDLYNDEYNSPAQMLAAFDADFIFVCVPTPTDPSDGRLDVSIVADCVKKWKDLSQNEESILVVKSTVPVGTIEELCDLFETDRVVHNPEFLTERTAMQDFMDADEIIVGGPNSSVVASVINLYSSWCTLVRTNKDNPMPKMVLTDAKTAEMVKMVRNSFYAAKIEIMNEVAELCESMELDYVAFREIFARSGKHAWVNPMHTYVPGPDGQRGFGGKCLSKDSLALETLGRTHDVDMAMLRIANTKNKTRRQD